MIFYRWKLTVNSIEYDSNPLIGDGYSIQGKLSDGQYYHRETFSGGLTFQGVDFDLIMARPKREYIYIELQRSTDGTSYSRRLYGRFTKANGEPDEDQRCIDVDVETIDTYEELESGKGKTLNVVDLEPPIVSLSGVRQPLFQVYIEGASFINNYYGSGVYEEQPVTPTFTGVGNDLELKYFFNLNIVGYFIAGDPSVLDPDVSGIYDFNTLVRQDNQYKIVTIGSGPSSYYEIQQVSDNLPIYRSDTGTFLTTSTAPFDTVGDGTIVRATFTSLTSSSTCRVYFHSIWARMLTTLETVDGNATSELPSDDIDTNNQQYTRSLPLDLTGLIEVSGLVSTDPTGLGKYDDNAAVYGGEYFVRPANLGNEQYSPISRSEWQAQSLWWAMNPTLRGYQELGSEGILIKDCYLLGDVISEMITEIAPGITHEKTAEYSSFLYGDSNSIRGTKRYPVITPKEHVKIGDYDQATTIAEMKFDDIINLLRIKYRCFIYIEDMKLKIEHGDFFERGKTYTGTIVGTDLTELAEGHHGKLWLFDTKKYGFDTEDIPIRFEFKWMDNVSLPFRGYAIDVVDEYAQPGNIKTETVNLFTSDWDFIIAQPGSISDTGFFIGDCDRISDDQYELPFLSLTVDDVDYKLQNGYSSFFYIHDQYYRTRLPATTVLINKVERTVEEERNLIQNVEFPGMGITDWMNLINSQLGSGLVKSYEEDVTNGNQKATLKHEG